LPDETPTPTAWLAVIEPRTTDHLHVQALAMHKSCFSPTLLTHAQLIPLYRKEELMTMNKTPEDEAFEALERAQASLPPFKEPSRHPADVQTEYNLYKAGVQDLQRKLEELNFNYSLICEHSIKLEAALKKTQRDLDQCQKSWLVALLFRLGLMK
jgi:hypothetical protein